MLVVAGENVATLQQSLDYRKGRSCYCRSGFIQINPLLTTELLSPGSCLSQGKRPEGMKDLGGQGLRGSHPEFCHPKDNPGGFPALMQE